MSTIHATVETKILLELTEGEAGALDAICGYDHEAFLRVFKDSLGKSYIEEYEDHIKPLFEKARKLHIAVKRLQDIRKEVRTIRC